jgi:hypothetical protein
VRRSEDHLVARLEQEGEDQQHRGRRAARHDHPLRIDVHPRAPAVLEGDRLAQVGEAAAVGVSRLTSAQRLVAGRQDRRWRREVGLADLEVDHLHPGALHLEGALEHFHGEKRLDLGGASGNPLLHAVRVAEGDPPCQPRIPCKCSDFCWFQVGHFDTPRAR